MVKLMATRPVRLGLLVSAVSYQLLKRPKFEVLTNDALNHLGQESPVADVHLRRARQRRLLHLVTARHPAVVLAEHAATRAVTYRPETT